MMINKEIKRHCNRLNINEGIILLNFMTDQICVKIREFLNFFSTMIHIIQNKCQVFIENKIGYLYRYILKIGTVSHYKSLICGLEQIIDSLKMVNNLNMNQQSIKRG